MTRDFDVIVVGARCAGSPLATMLARRGVRVCLLDQDSFPSDTLSTHGIQPTGVKVLERLGVREKLEGLAPPMVRARMVFDDCVANVPDVPAVVGAPVLSVRRVVLDEVLVDAAREAGADVRTETRVVELVRENGRVVGVKTKDGELRARLVVGADGTRSAVARMAGAQEYEPTPNGRLFMWSYFDGEPTGGEMWIGKRGDWAYLVTPCDHGLCLVGACPSITRRDEARRDREALYEEGIRAWPELHTGVEGARREGGVTTMANMHGYFRRSAGPGWALVGDAGHFKDPTPGQGIADALRQAESLAKEIERALGATSETRGDRVLTDWWRWRDEDAWEMYWFAHDAGVAGPTPPLLRELQRQLAADPALTEATVRVFNHELRPSEAYPPSFLLKTVGSALRRGRGERGAVARETASVIAAEVRRRRALSRLPSARVSPVGD